MDFAKTGKLEAFFSQFQKISYRRSELIIRENDSPQGIYYIHKGHVRIYCVDPVGKELTFYIFKPGSYFPLLWGLGDIENQYNYEAVTRTEVYRASKQNVIIFLKSNPDELFQVNRRILVGLNDVLFHMKYLLFGDSYHRVTSVLLIVARRFGEKSSGDRIKVSFPFTHQDIANLAGITRESTSIVMTKLKKKRLISYSRRSLVINNLPRLLEESYFGAEVLRR